MRIPVGAPLEVPFEPLILKLLANDARSENVPVLDVRTTDDNGVEVQYSPRSYGQVWLVNYVLTHQGEEVTTNRIADSGYPLSGRVTDIYKNGLIAIVKNLKRLQEAGMDIQNLGGRQHRRYHLPLFTDISVTYLGYNGRRRLHGR